MPKETEDQKIIKMLKAQIEEIKRRGLDNVQVVENVLEEVRRWAGHGYSGLVPPRKIPFHSSLQLVIPIDTSLTPIADFDAIVEAIPLHTIAVDMHSLRVELKSVPEEDRCSIHAYFTNGGARVEYAVSDLMLKSGMNSRYVKEEIARKVVHALTGGGY